MVFIGNQAEYLALLFKLEVYSLVSRLNQRHTSASAIIERLIKAAGVKTATALADILGVTPQAVSSAKKKGKIPHTWVQLISERFNISMDLLLHGSTLSHHPKRETESGPSFHHEMKRFWNGTSGDDKALQATPLPAHVTEEIFFLSRRLVEAQDEIRSLTEIKHKLEMAIQKLRHEKERLIKENRQLREQIRILVAEGGSGGFRNSARGKL